MLDRTLDVECRTDDCASVSVHSQESVVPSNETATSVAQPQYITLASSIWSYCGSDAGNAPSTIMPDAYHHVQEYSHAMQMRRKAKSNCRGDEVKLELFNAGRLLSIDAEAPQDLAELGRNDTD